MCVEDCDMDGKLEAGLLQLSSYSWTDGRSGSRGAVAIWWGRSPHAAQEQEQEVATEVVAEDKSRGYLEETDGANSFSGRLYCVM